MLDARSLQPNGSVPGSYANSLPAAVGRIALAAPDGGPPAFVDLGLVRPLAESQLERHDGDRDLS